MSIKGDGKMIGAVGSLVWLRSLHVAFGVDESALVLGHAVRRNIYIFGFPLVCSFKGKSTGLTDRFNVN